MTGTAYAEITIHLSKKPLVKGEKVPFTISGTEKGATYVVTVTAGDTVEKLRTGTDPDGMIPGVRSELRQIDRTAVLYNVASMSERVSRQVARSRFTSWLT